MNRLLSSNVVGDSNDEKNFPHKLLITNTFANGSSADIKLPKTQLHEKGQSGRFLGRVLGPLPKTCLSLMKNVTANAATHKKIFGSLIIFNEEMNDIIKIVTSLEESGLLIKSLSKTIKKKKRTKRHIS